MNKKVIAIIVFFALSIIFTMVYFLIKPKENKQVNNNPGQIKIKGMQENVNTKDFLNQAVLRSEDSYVLYYDSEFSLQYESKQNSFQITFGSIDKQTLPEIRKRSEEVFLEKLGISQADACKLYVTERIPNSDILQLENYIYPLSFCPQSSKYPFPE